MAGSLTGKGKFLALLLAFLLVWTLPGFGVSAAWADNVDDAEAAVDDAEEAVDDAQAVLDDAEAQLDEITEECDQLQDEIDQLQDEIDQMAASVLEAQQAMLDGRDALGETAAYQYRGEGTLITIISVLLESTTLTEVLQNVEYLESIMQYQAEEVEAQRQRKERFEELSDQLTEQKDTQEALLAEMEEKREEAQQVVDDATEKLSDAEGDLSSQLAALQAQAAAFVESSAESGVEIAEDANTIYRQEVVSDDTEVIEDPATSSSPSSSDDSDSAAASPSSSSSSSSSGSSSSSSSTSSSDGWLTGVASAYGGSTDPYTPNPGITATGAVCDDSSMGVAVPMSLANYRSYFGRTVEISYGGKTVYAVVNDCGYMGGGTRALDLQPGVWKAFGFTSCTAWGLRTVSYRFL